MKQIYSALTAIAFFVSLHANSQINENFNSGLPSSSNCWLLNDVTNITTNTIEGAGSAVIIGGTGEIQTPYLAFDGTATISFNYKLSGTSPNGSRTINVQSIDKSGNRTLITSIVVNTNSASSGTSVNLFSTPITITNVERIAVVVEKLGGGSVEVIIDNFIIDGAAYNYSEANPCNTAPVAADDDYFSVYPNGVEGNVLTNDNAPENNEVYTAVLVDNVEEGDLNLNADGSFTYSPNAGFAGGPITFSYRINDGGFNPLTSNIATVTLNYAMQTVLPVKLLNFSGSVVNQRAELTWTLDANETGNFIQIEKSTDGKTFAPVSVVMNTAKAGTETYFSKDASILTGTAYYRLKMVNKTGSFSFSKIIVLKNASNVKANSLTVLRNPVQASISFNYSSTEAGVASISVYNTAGARVLHFQHTMQKGINTIDQPLPSNFSNGTYVMEVVKNNDRSVVKLLK